ncbi:MAG: hypothetical protein P9M00_09290 [Candidatus Tritonobacter lacicola]|nr:hypothetical protein [Candidatus Tritonobacter lacicola]
MRKVFFTLLLSFTLFSFLSHRAAADMATVSSEAEYDNFINKIVNLIAMRQELSADFEKEKRIGEAGRVLNEVVRIENELDALGVDWRSFLEPGGKSAGCAFVKNTFFLPAIHFANLPRHIAKLFGRTARASDVAAGGEVLDSAFFINREIESFSPSDIARMAGRNKPRGRITPLEEKIPGRAARFFCEDEEGRCFLLGFDPPGMEEQATGAAVIGSTIARLLGYNVPVSAIITVEGTGNERFDGRRAAATELVPGAGGPWSCYGFRDRREIRASKVFAAWINNTGWVDHNTIISSFRVGDVGLHRYYVDNFDSSLGSAGMRPKLPKDGWEHSFDLGVIASTPMRLLLKPFGLWRERYNRGAKPLDSAVGLFDGNVDPARFEAEYPNMAWRYMTTEDALWAVNLISRFTPGQVGAIVDLAVYSDPDDAEYVKETLLRRRKKIMEHYLGKRIK